MKEGEERATAEGRRSSREREQPKKKKWLCVRHVH